MDPYAPITPAQENELVDLLAAGRGRLTRGRLRQQLRGLSTGDAAAEIRRARGEPEPVAVRVSPPALLASPSELADSLDAHFAGRRMQEAERGLSRPSLFAGYGGNPSTMTC